ncbi:class IIb bacteriocin, lactobin A/cerein 7B family [Streptococcus sp. H49]|uniref:class IIb bacteriocin, lactobin A/cerein 7B family n=1 Tax=Streptococcus huangxiaojuni TaxID=3237239 RepID=UPI0034A13DF2
MTKFETIDNIAKNYVDLSDKELMETEGGSITLTTGALIGLGLGAAGFGAGYYFGHK